MALHMFTHERRDEESPIFGMWEMLLLTRLLRVAAGNEFPVQKTKINIGGRLEPGSLI